jgi:hypothetical protein
VKSGVWGLCWFGFAELVVFAVVQPLLALLKDRFVGVFRKDGWRKAYAD